MATSQPTKVCGLTGGVGMGKSTVAEVLRARGAEIIDTDVLARQIVEPGEPALDEIRGRFGDSILDPGGRLRRDELARRVFPDPTARRDLEQILHPRIRNLWKDQVQTWRNQGRSIAVIGIPLLFETNAEGEFDATICVGCSPLTQRQRLAQRGWSPEEIEQRIAAQWSIEKKMSQADYVVWTEGIPETLGGQLERILQVIRRN